MYQIIANFSYRNFDTDPVTLIGQVVNQWRYNGQIIGREFGVTFHQDHFQVRLSTPEQESLLPKWNNSLVTEALKQAEDGGVIFESFEIVGQDYQADETSKLEQFEMLMLYTTYLDSCSPVRDQNMHPVPLYKVAGSDPVFSQALIKWQESWQACDQLQMNETLETESLFAISEKESELSIQGRKLAQRLEEINKTPTYYYLYRLGRDPVVEENRQCPNCHKNWKLKQPTHDIFHFKCEPCRLISNLSWEIL